MKPLMVLYVNGDSYTFGDEVEDKTRIWPYLISEKIGYKLVNEAECGASNELIVDKTLKYFSNPPQHHFDDVQNHLAIVVWSYPIRRHIMDDNGERIEIKAIDALEGKNPSYDFLTKYSYAYDDYLRYIRNILLLQYFFQSRQISYIMSSVEENSYFDKASIKTDDKNYFGLINHWNWVKDLSSIFGENVQIRKHPNEVGHEKIYKKMYEHIENKILHGSI